MVMNFVIVIHVVYSTPLIPNLAEGYYLEPIIVVSCPK
jgi:hypothetical protein